MFVRSPTITKPVSGVIRNGSRPLNEVNVVGAAGARGAHAVGPRRRSAGCARASVPQHPPTRFTSPARANSPSSDARDLGRLVEAAERVRQPGVRVGRDRHRGDLGERLDRGPHLARPERAVDADEDRVGVRDARPERLDRLARERAPAPVDDRDRDPERGGRARRPSPRRSPPSRSACRRSSRSAAGRRRRRGGPRIWSGVGSRRPASNDDGPERRVVDLRARARASR